MSTTHRRIAAFAIAVLVLGAPACSSDGGSSTDETGSGSAEAPADAGGAPASAGAPGPVTLEFADGSTLTLEAPGGATAEPFQDGVEVAAGTAFQIEVYPGVGSTSEYKSELDANEVNRVVQYLVDEPDELLWESEVAGASEFHFYAIIGEGDGYTCFDTRGPVYSEDEARAMLESCLGATAG